MRVGSLLRSPVCWSVVGITQRPQGFTSAKRAAVAEAVYHFEQAGNLCLARLAYNELAQLVTAHEPTYLPVPRFAHLLTYYRAVLAVEQHAWDEAAALLTDLRRLPNLDADLYARSTNTLGVQAYHQAQYDTSFRYYQEAHQAFQQLGDGLGQLRALINMAIVHNLLGQFHDAIARLQDGVTWAHTDGASRVDQQGHIDAVADHERQSLQQASASCVLAAQRLGDLGELGEELGQERPSQQFGDPASTATVGLRSVVVALHEVDLGIEHQRRDQPDHEPGIEVHDVGVDPHHEISLAGVERLPQGLALAVSPAVVDQHRRRVHHLGPGGLGHLGAQMVGRCGASVENGFAHA